MNFINIILIFFWLILIPFVFGKILLDEYNDKILYSWAFGIVFEMAIFFIISIPMIIMKISFNILLYSYGLVIFVLFAIFLFFLIKYRRKKFEILQFKRPSIFKIIAIILICMQLFIKIKYTNINNDDVTFVVLSKQMIQFGNMYTDSSGKLNSRRALAPISAYYATFSKLVGMDSTILTHSVMPILFIIMMYIVFYEFSKKIFKDKENPDIVLIFLSFLNLFAFTAKGVYRYLLLYTWFGRAILGGIILPMIWYFALDAMDEDSKLRNWILLFISIIASCLGSEMSVALVPISLGCLAIVRAIGDKKISYLLKSLICLIPCFIIGIIYIKIK